MLMESSRGHYVQNSKHTLMRITVFVMVLEDFNCQSTVLRDYYLPLAHLCFDNDYYTMNAGAFHKLQRFQMTRSFARFL